MDSKQNIVAACDAFLVHKSEVLIATTFATAALLGAVVGSVLAADSSNTVSIDNFIFTPKALTVKAGTSVTWTNHDDIPHGIASSDNTFKRSTALDTDDSYSFTFTAPGTYQYFCYLHPHMVGSIVVEATTGSNATR
jgi:plastocyanin